MGTFWSEIAEGFGESIEKAVYEMATESVYVPTAALRPALALWLEKQGSNKTVKVPGSDCSVRLSKSEASVSAQVYRSGSLIATQKLGDLEKVASYLDEVLSLTVSVGGPTAVQQDLKKSESAIEKVKYVLNFAFDKLEKAEAEKSRVKEAAESIAHLDSIVQRFKQAKLNKANEPKFQTGQKAGAMAQQAPSPPMPGAKGAATTPKLNAPQNTADFDKPAPIKSTTPKVKATPGAPKPPKSPSMKMAPAQGMGKSESKIRAKKVLVKDMSLALPKVTKDELSSAKSDVGEKLFKQAASGEYKFNPTGAQSVMNKGSVEIRKSQDGLYSIYTDGRQWDKDNILMLAALVKLNKNLKRGK